MLKEWLKTLLALTVLLGLFDLILPPGEGGKFPKLVIGLAMMLAVLQPVIGFLQQNSLAVTLFQINGLASDLAEVQASGSRLQEIGVRPFFDTHLPEQAEQLESLLLLREDLTDVVVTFQNNLGELGVEIKISPFNNTLQARVERIAKGILNVQAVQIRVKPL